MCLRPFDFADEYVFAIEPDLTITNAIIHVPAGRWNKLWGMAGRDKDATYAPMCLYERLKRRYLDDRSQPAD